MAQLFVQLYPEPGCSRMHANFGSAYRKAVSGAAGDDWEDIPSRTLVAVA